MSPDDTPNTDDATPDAGDDTATATAPEPSAAVPFDKELPFDKDSTENVIKVAVGLCLVCSLIVSVLAVGLKDVQEANKERFRKQNILAAAERLIAGDDGELDIENDVDRLYDKHVVAEFVELENGATSTEFPLQGDYTVDTYDLAKAVKIKTLTEKVEAPNTAGLTGAVREKVSLVYRINDADGKPLGYVLPVRGYGLWSVLWGFIALETDGRTIRGLTFYEHKETPGLGGEVDNPSWKAKWNGKIARDEAGTVVIEVAKGATTADTGVDGLAGATITSRGVTNMLKYWLGPRGFGPFLERETKE